MGVLEQEYNELHKLMADYKAGKVTDRQVDTQIKIFKAMEARQRNMIAIQVLDIKSRSRKPSNSLIRANIIGNKTAIDIAQEDHENEKIICPNTGNTIARSECLDVSGTGDGEQCHGCEHIGITRKLLIDGS